MADSPTVFTISFVGGTLGNTNLIDTLLTANVGTLTQATTATTSVVIQGGQRRGPWSLLARRWSS